MSGIYIPGMEMPTRCCDCKMYVEDIYYCPLLQREIENPWADDGVELDCPLISVREHGDLKDTDALRQWILTEMASLDTEEDREFVADRLANELPTIIPASGGTEDE